MKKERKYIIFFIAIIAMAGLFTLFFSHHKNEPTFSPENHAQSLPNPDLADWKTGDTENFELIYKTSNINTAFSSHGAGSTSLSERNDSIQSNHYALIYTIHNNINYIDASIDMKSKEIKVKGLHPAEEIHLEFDGKQHSAIPSDWAGKLTISFSGINLEHKDHLCLSFNDSNIGFCHRFIKKAVNKKGIVG